MEKAVRILLLAALVTAGGPLAAGADDKRLPPAFGKELVPDGQAERRQEPAESDADDRPASRGRSGSDHARGGQLDADGDDPIDGDDESDEPGDF